MLKTYRFKTDIPFNMVKKTIWRYCYGAWSVSEREFEYEVIVKEWDKGVIEKIKEDALEYYKKYYHHDRI